MRVSARFRTLGVDLQLPDIRSFFNKNRAPKAEIPKDAFQIASEGFLPDRVEAMMVVTQVVSDKMK